MSEFQKYVPIVEVVRDVYVPSVDRTVQVTNALAHSILFSGDQKTAARGRGAQKAKIKAVSPIRRLDGLIPVAADWHAKVILLHVSDRSHMFCVQLCIITYAHSHACMQVIWKYFYSSQSAGDHGTLFQLRNKLNRTNFISTPKNDVNACEDFISIITSGLLVAAALTTYEMDSVDDIPSDNVLPNAELVWTLTNGERQDKLNDLCGLVYDKFVNFKFNTTEVPTSSVDSVFKYAVQLLRMCCFYMEFTDAIKEGDGGRVIRCWKYMLPIFSASGNTNYTCEAANLVVQHSYTLSPRLSAQLQWSCFVNVHGRPGKNIPVDLHMEHLNKVAKNGIRYLGQNKSEKAITRLGQAIGVLAPVVEKFDEENTVAHSTSRQKPPKAQKDIEVVVNELIKVNCFVDQKTPRKHQKFPKP